jgi:sigma-B regulation protein RsbU (phosphoserine phosphatase)
MKFPFATAVAPERTFRKPAPSNVPALQTGTLAALYRSARKGGDFFDFASVRARLIFLLLDIAGARDEALDIAAAAQDAFRAEIGELFNHSPVNEADALSNLTVALNRMIIAAAGGVHCAPAFLGSYDEEVGTVTYINAGHTPALVKDQEGVELLGASGLPLGLFSHATHDAQIRVLPHGAALLLVSKGLVESRYRNQEFGLERLQETLKKLQFTTATELSSAVLTRVQQFTKNTPPQNDVTALALVRAELPVLAPAAVVVRR